MSIVLELTLGLSFRILRPSGLESMVSRKRGSAGPAVVSPNAATMSLRGVTPSALKSLFNGLTASSRARQ